VFHVQFSPLLYVETIFLNRSIVVFEKMIDPPTIEKVSNHIPDDFKFSILSKLPLKSLVRFRCVRKSWSLLFKNLYFMNMYRNNFISNNNFSYVVNFYFMNMSKTFISHIRLRGANLRTPWCLVFAFWWEVWE
jgi:hypothetical protein